jgi:hypothetical protein
MTKCTRSAFAHVMHYRSSTPIAQSSASNSSIGRLVRSLRQTIQLSLCQQTAAAATLPWPGCDPSVHHVLVPGPTWHLVVLVRSSVAIFLTASCSSMVALTAGNSPSSGEYIVSALLPHVRSSPPTLTLGALGVG